MPACPRTNRSTKNCRTTPLFSPIKFSKRPKRADTEEDIRIAIENQLAFIKQRAGITLVGKHEVTVASGRIDSVYDRVVIEYKNPASPGDRIGPKADSPGTKKVVEQIKKRFYDLRSELGHKLNTLFGVGTDGRHFVFVRFRDDKWQVQDPVEVNRYSAERFLWALYNLGQKGKFFSAEYLAGDFGSEAKLAQDGIRALYEAIKGADHPKAQTFFNKWKILFGEVCGYDVDSPSDKIKKLAHYYGIRERGLAPAEMLFAVHTYYAVFMKLLASEIVAFFHKLPTPLQKMIQAPTSAKLKREMEELEAGSIFRHLNITNFLEGDLFAWYLSVWSDEIDDLIRKMVTKLDDYNPGTMSEDPAGSRDLLQRLYQELFPKAVRHDLGEYYTPDWLAEHVLNELKYSGDPDKRILDPACGSGTFLVMAIVRIRRWYDEHRENCSFGDDDLCRKILANVVGFDLNPLAVMAARTNYLIAIRDLIGHVDKIEIPIYLCDSILTPSEYGDLFTGRHGSARELKTAAARFLIPSEIATNREHVSKYAEQLEHCVQNGYKPAEFIERCREESLPIDKETLHVDLYSELVALDKANKNGVWARIIKNAFAPLFVGTFDYVAGNPPWVNWESLPNQYRSATAPIWQRYGLFTHKGLKARLGGGKDDISILMTYVAHDFYLKNRGALGFVITQSVFKTKGGGQGFRSLAYGSGKSQRFLAPLKVDDFSAFQPFDGAANRTAVFVAGKGERAVAFPVPYRTWTKKQDAEVTSDMSLEIVREQIDSRKLQAVPVDSNDRTSPWLTSTVAAERVLNKIRGASTFKPRKGVYCPTNSIYWLTSAEPIDARHVMVTNLADTGKRKVDKVTQSVERAFVFPLVRGKDVQRWQWKSELSIILPQDPESPSTALSDSKLKSKFPKTYSYFRHFEKDIRGCALLKQFFDPDRDPFYSSYNVGPYTFGPYKVVWKEICPEIEAAVIDSHAQPTPIIPDHKLVLVAFDEAQPAYFLCGLLNSSIVRLFVRTYATSSSLSGHIAEFVALPDYSPRDARHRKIADVASRCHSLASTDSVKDLRRAEQELDRLAGTLLGISNEDVDRIEKELAELCGDEGAGDGEKVD